MFRYTVLYFLMLVVFVALLVGPIVAGKMVPKSLTKGLDSTHLLQPVGQDNDDTRGHTQTGTGMPNYAGIYTPSSAAAPGSAATSAAARLLI